MSHKKTSSIFSRPLLRKACIVLGCMVFSFGLGIQTAGEVHIASTRAGSLVIPGDLNGNGHLDVDDAKIALAIARGLESATPAQLEADPNGDFRITIEDAMAILNDLSH